jgi:hypothetical protein
MRTMMTALALAGLISGFRTPLFAGDEGSVTVKTDPEGIEVWIDGKYLGDSPIAGKMLKAGRYTIKLVDPIQHTSLSEEVLVQSGKDVILEKTMKGKFGGLKVDSDPEGAQVSLLTSLGKTPLSNDFMNPGKYRIEIRHPRKRYAVVSEDIVIPRGETVTLNKTLEKTSPFNMKALVRLGLGAGAVASFVWAIVEQGNYKDAKARDDFTNDPKADDDAHSAAVQRVFGIVLGSACVVGFEIVAFF